MNKKIIYAVSGVVVMIIILIAVIAGSSSSASNPQKLTEKFRETVQNNDANGLKSMVKMEKEMIWPDNQVEATLELLREEGNFEEVMQILHVQAGYYGDETAAASIDEHAYELVQSGVFYIEEEEGFLGNNYQLRVRPYEVNINADQEAMISFLDDEYELSGEDSTSLGTYGPGVYSMEGKLDSKYASNTVEEEITLFDQEDFNIEHSVDLSGDPITAMSDIPNTNIFIKSDQIGEIEEEDVGVPDSGLSGRGKGVEIGEISAGHEIHGEIELPWGTAVSPSVEIESDIEAYEITPDPVSMEGTEKELTNAVNNYVQQRMAYRTQETEDKLKSVSEIIESDLEQEVQRYNNEDYLEGEVHGTRIDFGNVDYEHGDGGEQKLSIPVERHVSTKMNREYFGDKEFTEDYEKLIIDVVYEDQEWIIQNEDKDYGASDPYMTGDRVVETTF